MVVAVVVMTMVVVVVVMVVGRAVLPSHGDDCESPTPPASIIDILTHYRNNKSQTRCYM